MKYISVLEYLNGKIRMEDMPDDWVRNLNTLIPAVNTLLERFGESRRVNSGFRTPEDQARINPKAKASKHMCCAAVDVSDPKGTLKAWILKNIKVLDEVNLYCEDFNSTPTWVHFQCIPPASKRRIFLP